MALLSSFLKDVISLFYLSTPSVVRRESGANAPVDDSWRQNVSITLAELPSQIVSRNSAYCCGAGAKNFNFLKEYFICYRKNLHMHVFQKIFEVNIIFQFFQEKA